MKAVAIAAIVPIIAFGIENSSFMKEAITPPPSSNLDTSKAYLLIAFRFSSDKFLVVSYII
ncbi:MAG: hypothetical protein LBO71_11070 [Prevotellaceae bacterium]|nr:hypothetical protein [Prevotellaceae bacterium]